MKVLLILISAIALFGSDYALMKKSFDKGDISRAITYARTNAMQGNIAAMYDLGLLYYAKGDTKKAKTWLERSVKNDGKGLLGVSLIMFTQSRNKKGYTKVTESLINEPKGKVRDALMAVSKDLASNRFDASAEDYLLLGELFSSDKIVHIDMQTALFLINQAANKGNALAMEKMGDAYWQSSYTQGSFIMAPQTGNRLEIAFEYYEKATELGNLDAMAKLGKLYIIAPWMINNVRKGSQLILLSAQGGSALGAQLAGEIYWDGQGVRQDRQLSVQWYEKATKICEVNRLLAAYYKKGSKADSYAKAYEKCFKPGGKKHEYHILFQPF